MKKWIFVVLTIFLFKILSAQENVGPDKQGIIIGKVIDSSSLLPIDYATVTVYISGNNKPVNGVTTDAKGLFKLEGLAPGNYRLVIDFIGYRSREKNNILISTRQSNITLGNFFLYPSTKTMAGVTITAQKGLIENKIDKNNQKSK